MRCLFALSILILVSMNVMAKHLTSIQITEDVMRASVRNPTGNFLNWHVEGACFWLKPGYPPTINMTLKVNHFVPDTVIVVYEGYKHNPWTEVNKYYDPWLKKLGDTLYTFKDHIPPENDGYDGASTNSMEKFKEIDIVGDPGLSFFSASHNLLLQSYTSPYYMYYSSLLDSYFWTSPNWEDFLNPEYIIPGVRIVGTLLDNWGGVYPRVGYINQLGDYKAAAVIAERGTNIVANGGMFRVSTMLPMICGEHCYVYPAIENDFDSVKFQEVYPNSSITAKDEFGSNDLLDPETYGQDQYDKGKGAYVWIMWRHYKGCIQGVGKFLWST